MTRRVLAALGCMALAVVLTVRAEPPEKADPKKADGGIPAAKIDARPDASSDKAIGETSRLSREYKQFEELLLNLAQRMEKSPRAEDKEKAKALRAAIDIANQGGVENRFTKLLTSLVGKDSNRTLTTDDLEKAAGQNEELIKILDEMLKVLLTDSELLKKQAEAKRIEEMIKQINKQIRDEKIRQSVIDGKKVDNKTNEREQNKITKATESTARQMGAKPGEPKDPKDGKPKDPKDGKPMDPKDGKPMDPKDGKPGEPKDGKPGEPKDGKPKDGKPGEPKDGKPGEPKDGKPSDGPPPPPNSQQPPPELPGKKQIQDANDMQKKVEDDLKKNKPEDASPKIDKVIEDLEKAKAELEKRLKQLREEELERLLANLQGRCERMLAAQIQVYEGTKQVDGVVKNYPDKKPTRAEEQKSQQLSTNEGNIVKEANNALRLLENEGTAVAFAAAMESVRDDMIAIEKRLDKYVTNESTQHIEEDVIAALKEMIEALKKAKQELQDKKNQPPPPPKSGPPPPQKLLDILAELKLIRSMQMQVNKRTTDNGRQYQGEQADDKLIQDELNSLAKKQAKLEGMLKDIASGKNK